MVYRDALWVMGAKDYHDENYDHYTGDDDDDDYNYEEP